VTQKNIFFFYETKNLKIKTKFFKQLHRCVREIIQQQVDNINEMKKYVQNAEKDCKTLDEKIKKKKLDLERSETRLKALTNVKPAFMDEYERLEKELEKLYNEYIEKFRNLDYLEHQLDVYNKQEEEKCLESQKVLEKIRKNLQENELKILRGEQEVN
jgi:clusterin-associated protein 1